MGSARRLADHMVSISDGVAELKLVSDLLVETCEPSRETPHAAIHWLAMRVDVLAVDLGNLIEAEVTGRRVKP